MAIACVTLALLICVQALAQAGANTGAMPEQATAPPPATGPTADPVACESAAGRLAKAEAAQAKATRSLFEAQKKLKNAKRAARRSGNAAAAKKLKRAENRLESARKKARKAAKKSARLDTSANRACGLEAEVKKKKGTIEADPSEVVSLSGDPNSTQTLVLVPSVKPPKPGNAIVVDATATSPGVLATATDTKQINGGRTKVSLKPATLDQAYSEFDVSFNGSFGNLDALTIDESTERSASPGRLRLGAAALSCTGPRPQNPNVVVDLRPLKPSMDIDVANREIFFLLAGEPRISTSMQLSGSCEANLPRYSVPVFGPITIDIAPELSITASGAKLSFSWQPRIAVGFHKGGGQNTDYRVLNPGSSSLSLNPGARVEAFAGGSLGVSLAGRAGIRGKFGPVVDLSADDTCRNAHAALRIGLDVYADVFISRVTFPVAKGEYLHQQIYGSCSETGDSSGGGSGGDAGTGGGGSGSTLPQPELVSLTSAGMPGNDDSGGFFDPVATSADAGQVAFYSDASNLVSGDTNGSLDIFVRDRMAATTERVSVSSTEGQANAASHTEISISADGRFVAFASDASNLVPGDVEGHKDIFVRDRVMGTTERITAEFRSDGGALETGSARFPSISGDGRFVVFHNANRRVFVYDRNTGVKEDIHVTPEGEEARGSFSSSSSISADGRFVAYASDAPDLVDGDTNQSDDVFVRDRLTDVTERVSVGPGQEQGNAASGWRSTSISDDGRYIAFTSDASNLDENDENGERDVFVRDREAGTTERIGAGLYSGGSSISADGRYVVFHGFCGIPPSVSVCRHDLQTDETEVVNNTADAPAIADDGQHVVFSSSSPLVAADDNGAEDVYVVVLDP